LAPDLVRGCNGHARGADCQCRVLACLDATPASACNDRRQEQAFGDACVPGSLAAGQKASVRSTRIQGLSSHQARVCDQEDQLFAIGRQRSLAARRLTGSSAPPASHRPYCGCARRMPPNISASRNAVGNCVRSHDGRLSSQPNTMKRRSGKPRVSCQTTRQRAARMSALRGRADEARSTGYVAF
jgi:hypothetical protein